MAGFAVTRNNLYQTIPTLHKQWSLTVDIMQLGRVSGWTNVLHFGLGCYENQTPGIWHSSLSTTVRIKGAINGDLNNLFNGPALRMDTWTRVEITQFRQIDGSYQYTIIIGGKIYYQVTNNYPEEFSNVKVYTSGNYSPAANTKITNPIIWTSMLH